MAGTAGPVATSTRPATQSPASAASRQPVGVPRPLHARAVVSKNPVSTAAANPKTISCACHAAPPR